MHPSEVWILLAAALFIGGCGGWLLGHWRAYQECCECCTCQDCTEGNGYEDPDYDYPLPPMAAQATDHRATLPVDPWRPGADAGRRVVLLEPGPTIYPALAELAQEALDGSESHADGPDTSTWLRTWRLEVEAAYPIPGTPQWEARHTVGVQ